VSRFVVVVGILAAALSGAAACNASFPTEPGAPATQLQYQSPTPSVLNPGALVTMLALRVDSDQLYRNVSREAVWASSNSSVVQVNGGVVRAIAPGLAEISATFEGAAASISIAVQPLILFPRLEVRPMADPRIIGNTATGRVLFFESNTSFQDVSTTAVWRSSNPNVATVSGNAVTGAGVGTTEVTITWGSLSIAYRLSIEPIFR
jgi:hypothetical protein